MLFIFSPLFQGSQLVITGHSLGAGAAALLSVLMKPMYPDLICFAFAPPGGLMRYDAINIYYNTKQIRVTKMIDIW